MIRPTDILSGKVVGLMPAETSAVVQVDEGRCQYIERQAIAAGVAVVFGLLVVVGVVIAVMVNRSSRKTQR